MQVPCTSITRVCTRLYSLLFVMHNTGLSVSVNSRKCSSIIIVRFILVDIGDAGRHSDGGVLSNSEFGQALENGTLHFPAPSPLSGLIQPDLPYVIVGDAAFPLRTNMLRPYPGKHLPG